MVELKCPKCGKGVIIKAKGRSYQCKDCGFRLTESELRNRLNRKWPKQLSPREFHQ